MFEPLCEIQPSPGQSCPIEYLSWVERSGDVDYIRQLIFDVLFLPPENHMIETVGFVAVSISIYMIVPRVTSMIIIVLKKATGI